MYLSVPIYFLSAQVPLFHDNRIRMVVSSDAHMVHYKNKLVVLTTEWLPWLQTNWITVDVRGFFDVED